MSFAHPWALLFLLLLIPVGFLYWLRLRVPRAVVGTGPFWQMALAEERFRAGWQRWRTPASLLLHSLVVILLAMAAAGPEVSPPQRIVLILDNSATMRAMDRGQLRLYTARDAALPLIRSLRWCDEMAVVATNPEPVEIQAFTSDQSLLVATLGKIKADTGPPAIDWAIRVARAIAAPERTPGRIVFITDAIARDEVRNAQGNGVEVVRVGESADNRAITCFTARRTKVDPAQCQVFVLVQNHSDRSAQGNIELSIDGRPGDTSPFAIEKDGRWQHLFELKLAAAAQLTARITPEDAYPFDDAAQLNVPAPPASDIVGQPLRGSVRGADTRIPADIGKDASTVRYASPGTPLWIPLAAIAGLLLVLDWCLYQRRWTS